MKEGTYQKAGVDIPKGDEFVRRIRPHIRSTFTPAVLADIGGFGSFVDGGFPGIKSPVLVSSTDGVGTKLRVAFLTGRHDTVGQDLVNHCVNDIAVCGATPLFFQDYLAFGRLNLEIAGAVVGGMVKACKENSCPLVGGETAEMPGFYRDDEYDLAGTIVGVVEKSGILDGRKVRAGDVLIGLPSTGLHTNGYSLARSVLLDKFEHDDFIEELGMRVGEALMAVHRSYLKPIQAVTGMAGLHAIAHITGGGIVGNTSRVVPDACTVAVDWQSWKRPAIFGIIQKHGNVPEDEMRRTFNLGIGLVMIGARRSADGLMKALRGAGERPLVIGEVQKQAEGEVLDRTT